MKVYAIFLLTSGVALGCQDREPVSMTRTTSVVLDVPPRALAAPAEAHEAPARDLPAPAVVAGPSMPTPAADEDSTHVVTEPAPTRATEPARVAITSGVWTDGAQETHPRADQSGVTPGWTNGAGQTNSSTAGATVGAGATPGWTNGAEATSDSAAGATVSAGGAGVTPGWTNGAQVTNGSTSGATVTSSSPAP